MERHQHPTRAQDQPRLLDQVRDVILHYSILTEQSDINWIRRFILFHGKRYPAEMDAPEVQVPAKLRRTHYSSALLCRAAS
ncbi:MAG: phage integrase N-terminal SAM-like domain-containing protein [Gammaproteobacteria bacterium]